MEKSQENCRNCDIKTRNFLCKECFELSEKRFNEELNSAINKGYIEKSSYLIKYKQNILKWGLIQDKKIIKQKV